MDTGTVLTIGLGIFLILDTEKKKREEEEAKAQAEQNHAPESLNEEIDDFWESLGLPEYDPNLIFDPDEFDTTNPLFWDDDWVNY